jgi:hypothetical protein
MPSWIQIRIPDPDPLTRLNADPIPFHSQQFGRARRIPFRHQQYGCAGCIHFAASSLDVQGVFLSITSSMGVQGVLWEQIKLFCFVSDNEQTKSKRFAFVPIKSGPNQNVLL